MPTRFEPISSICKFIEPASAISSLWRICFTAGAVPESKLNINEPRLSNSFCTRTNSSSGSVLLRLARFSASLGKFCSARIGNVSSRKRPRNWLMTEFSMMLVEKPLPEPDVLKFSAYMLTGMSPRSCVAMVVRIIDATRLK